MMQEEIEFIDFQDFLRCIEKKDEYFLEL